MSDDDPNKKLEELQARFDDLIRQLRGESNPVIPTGLGAPRGARINTGLACAGGPCAPGEVEYLMLKAPRLALARARGIPFDPFPYMVTTTFAAAGTQTNPDVGPNKQLSRDAIFHAIDVDVQDATEFVGNVFKAERDFYLAITSGVQCTIKIEGVSRWSTPFFPLRALERLIAPQDPWILQSAQGILMDFTTTTGLPAAGIIVSCAFLGVTPSSDSIVRMENFDALRELDSLGYDTKCARQRLGC